MRKRTTIILSITAVVLLCHRGLSQYSPYSPNNSYRYKPPSTDQQPKSYTNYYNNQVRNYHRPPVNVRDYTIDKYYARNTNLSPYLNLGRRGSVDTLNNYYRYVRPEVQRRSNINTPTTKSVPKFNSNPYFNQIYNPISR